MIIPTKNGGPLFQRVLSSVLAQSTTWPFEVLVIDSGSSDGTTEFCESSPSVRLHSIRPEEFGHGTTRNLGVEMTSGEFVAFLTQDALPADRFWLAELVRTTEATDNIAGTFGRHVAYPGSNPFVARNLDRHFAGFARGPTVVTRLDNRERWDTDRRYRQRLHFFSNNNSCIRRTVWEEIPFPNVDFAEDQIWAQKVLEAGYAKAYANNAVVFHSHNYSVIDTARRSFDESRALRRLFGYRTCPTLLHLLARSGRDTLEDWGYAISQPAVQRKMTWLFKSPLLNVSRQLGFYVGQYESFLSSAIVRRVSRDRSSNN